MHTSEPIADRALLEIEAERFATEVGIPPCPAILTRFSAEIHSGEPDLRKLAGLIANDVGLSAAMLSMVNSPCYGLTKKAATVQQALSILGLRASANIVTGLMLKFAFSSSDNRLLQQFWEESAGTAAAAAGIAARLDGIKPDVAHTYVLFRDCGIPVMLRKTPGYSEVFEAYREMPGRNFIAVEDHRFRFNHARVGFALARGWLLPDSICKAILYHHQPELASAFNRDIEPADPRLVAFGILTEQVVALRSGRGLCSDWQMDEAFALQTLGLTADDVVDLVADDALVAV